MNHKTNLERSKSLHDQLIPLSLSFREKRARIEPVCQVTLRLKPGLSGNRFQQTVRVALRWMNNRAGQKLPEAAWAMKSFEMSDVGAQRTSAVSLNDQSYWAARLDDADKEVPQRTWITEIGIALDNTSQDVIFGTRLICTARGENPPYEPTVPGFVREIVEAGACELDGQSCTGDPRLVEQVEDVQWLIELLEQKDRIADVIVLSQQERNASTPQTVVNAKTLAQKLRGVAHIVILSSDAAFELTRRVGKDLSVFRQAVRTYRPGFLHGRDEPANHPLAMPERVLQWPGGPGVFELELCRRAIKNSAYVPDRESSLPSFNTVRRIASQLERESAREGGATDAELLRLYEDDNQKLRKEIDDQKEEFTQLLAYVEQERDTAIQKSHEVSAQGISARDRIRLLEKKLASTGKADQTPIPTDFLDFEDWCNHHLAGSVIVNKRAFQGAKKSDYEDPALAYKALIVLRDKYVPMRIEGGLNLKADYETALRELGLEDSATGDGAKFEGDEYTVMHFGKKRLFERHLKAGNSRESRYCFRLYFFWDDEEQVAVVGWLPSHLENRMT
jgi:hypothetical protein